MDTTLQRISTTLANEFADLGDVEQITRAALRLALAALLGGVIGFEREAKGKAAGLRTHMLVTLGAALFITVLQQSGAGDDALSRVIQGITAGIGFLCAGTILKGDDTHRVRGLTTAAGLWLSTAIGIAVGSGHAATAVLGTLMAVLVLHALRWFERHSARTPPALRSATMEDEQHVP
ncbi:MAG: Protein SrpB [Stenotrophomonas maltophilia]|nr:MAG: Protein SrpB [Stenotrophomonas maltophilia]